MSKNSIEASVSKVMSQVEEKIQETANQSIWETLQEFKPRAEERLRQIIWENYYQAPKGSNMWDANPNSEYYDRTYQFLNCGFVSLTQGGGHYVMSAYLNIDELNPVEPADAFHIAKSGKHKGEEVRTRKLWSYSYSYGQDFIGEPLDDDIKQEIINYKDEKYHILSDWEQWVNSEIMGRFENKFRVALKRNFGGEF